MTGHIVHIGVVLQLDPVLVQQLLVGKDGVLQHRAHVDLLHIQREASVLHAGELQ